MFRLALLGIAPAAVPARADSRAALLAARLWFTESRSHFPDSDEGGSIDSVTGTITEQPRTTGGDSLAGITAGPDGTLWFAERPRPSAESVGSCPARR